MQNQTYTPKDLTTAEKMRVISDQLDDLDRRGADLRAQIATLEIAGICTGVVHWRNKNGRKYLYANHRTDEACPIHGQPPPDRRLRVYVGLDPEKQAQVLAAMKRRREKLDLESAIRQTEIQRDRIKRSITTAYHAATGRQRWEW